MATTDRAAILRATRSASRPRPTDQHRAERPLERQSGEVEAGHARLVERPPVLPHDRQLDPAEVLAEAGAPHHVRHVEHAAVTDDGLPALYPRHAIGDPLDAGGGEIGALDPQERPAVRADVAAHLAADGGADVEHAGPHLPQQGEDRVGHPPLDRERDLPGVPPAQVGAVRGRDLVRDVRAGVRGADHQHRALGELGRVAVLAGVQLPDLRREAGREVRHARRPPEGAGRHDHVVRVVPFLAGHHQVAVAVADQAVDVAPVRTGRSNSAAYPAR